MKDTKVVMIQGSMTVAYLLFQCQNGGLPHDHGTSTYAKFKISSKTAF